MLYIKENNHQKYINKPLSWWCKEGKEMGNVVKKDIG